MTDAPKDLVAIHLGRFTQIDALSTASVPSSEKSIFDSESTTALIALCEEQQTHRSTPITFVRFEKAALVSGPLHRSPGNHLTQEKFHCRVININHRVTGRTYYTFISPHTLPSTHHTSPTAQHSLQNKSSHPKYARHNSRNLDRRRSTSELRGQASGRSRLDTGSSWRNNAGLRRSRREGDASRVRRKDAGSRSRVRRGARYDD